MTDMTIELVHRVRLVTDHRVVGLGCRPVCSCGWAGSWTDDCADALTAGSDHLDTAIGPPDAMDHLMSGLLDLQDDLAGIVVWLAENWSADLPVPDLHGLVEDRDSEPVAIVQLLATTSDPAVLARVADRLGVPTHTDTQPDPSGTGLQRAERRFGRVLVEVMLCGEDER
jgi:hypothetical protein